MGASRSRLLLNLHGLHVALDPSKACPVSPVCEGAAHISRAHAASLGLGPSSASSSRSAGGSVARHPRMEAPHRRCVGGQSPQTPQHWCFLRPHPADAGAPQRRREVGPGSAACAEGRVSCIISEAPLDPGGWTPRKPFGASLGAEEWARAGWWALLGVPAEGGGEEGTGSLRAPAGCFEASSAGLKGLLLQRCRELGEGWAAGGAPEVPEIHGLWGHWLPADLRTSYKIKRQRGRQGQAWGQGLCTCPCSELLALPVPPQASPG